MLDGWVMVRCNWSFKDNRYINNDSGFFSLAVVGPKCLCSYAWILQVDEDPQSLLDAHWYLFNQRGTGVFISSRQQSWLKITSEMKLWLQINGIKQVKRGNNIVADRWVGASNPHLHLNSHPTLKHTQLVIQGSHMVSGTQCPAGSDQVRKWRLEWEQVNNPKGLMSCRTQGQKLIFWTFLVFAFHFIQNYFCPMINIV